jgi:hypothetical protein
LLSIDEPRLSSSPVSITPHLKKTAIHELLSNLEALIASFFTIGITPTIDHSLPQ